MRERQQIDDQLAGFADLENDLTDCVAMLDLAADEEDPDFLKEAEAALDELTARIEQRRVDAMLSGEADANHAYVEIHAGAGGAEGRDWAAMLLRMYLRWGQAHGYEVKLIGESAGEDAGIKSATLRLEGAFAYGRMKTESGVHRLVRISPFDANARRHTSFASVWVYPEVDDHVDIVLRDDEVRIDTYRASGAGGQHVNTTDSAVRITHLPSGIVVQCQNERSQHKNRATAWKMLRARLYEAELQRREEATRTLAAQKSDIGWGNQIRSYVLQPYQLVKDLRTGVESSNPAAVLDGDLDAFIAAALAARIGDGRQTG